jgi:adenosylhomocysteine nucleosidase
VAAGGGTPAGAAAAAERLVAQGVTGLVSFGLAGGLDPALRPGAVVVPSVVLAGGVARAVDAGLAERFGGVTGHTMLAGSVVAASAAEKRDLRAATGAHAIDLESGAVADVAAAHGLTFVVVRAVCDPAERDLPPAALIALDPAGGIGIWGVLRSVLAAPWQVPGLLALARDAGQGRRALVAVVRRFAGGLG